MPGYTGNVLETRNYGKKRRKKKFSMNHDLSALTSLCIIKQTELGPSVVGDTVPSSVVNKHDMIKLGCYYSAAIGQGAFYHCGLYGPLPVLGSRFRCLIFSTLIVDEKQPDKRMKGKNYLLACFFYHEKLDEIASGKRQELERSLIEYFHDKETIDSVISCHEELKERIKGSLFF